ncbi:MAG: hypothetical protein CMO78_03870 [Verrucomicrobiales bacterium]|nr:hypothetical protein [Verrucomicrobiales bacterium]
MDPLGNIPTFHSILNPVPEERRRAIILRELLIALGILFGFLFAGQYLLSLLGLSQPAKVRVFVLGDAPNSTRLKIMSFPQRPGLAPDQKYIHSTLGLSYLTLRVADMDAAVGRLKKAKVKLLGQTPASLGGQLRITVFHDPDGNFVELIGPVK